MEPTTRAGSTTERLVEGEPVDEAAVVVLGVEAAVHVEDGLRAQVTVEDLTVVAHRLDGVVEGVGGEPRPST